MKIRPVIASGIVLCFGLPQPAFKDTAKRKSLVSHEVLRSPSVWKHTETTVEISPLVWSPNRRSAAYILKERRNHRTDFVRVSLCVTDRKSARRLYTGSVKDETEPRIACWAATSERILFFKCVFGASSANADGSELFDIGIRGGTPRLLTNLDQRNKNAVYGGMMRSLENIVFSPNGKYLLLVRGYGRFMVDNKRVALMRYPWGVQRMITGEQLAAIHPVWSPDGRLIAYTATRDRGERTESDDIIRRWSHMHLLVMNQHGGSNLQLTNDEQYRDTEPRWTRDGLEIQFVRTDNADVEGTIAWNSRRSLWCIRPDGSRLRKLHDLPPAKSP